jgi:uncharacterized protein
VIAALFGFVALLAVSRGFRRLAGNVLLAVLVSSGNGRPGGASRGGHSRGGGWGGGFSGGGGSSGGGGASGGW